MGSLHKQKKDMNLYHVQLKDKFKDANSASLEEFLKYVNKGNKKGYYRKITKTNPEDFGRYDNLEEGFDNCWR
jgi:hypothetical protein